MSAKDNLNRELFHGTGHFFAEGEFIDPAKGKGQWRDYKQQGRVFAATVPSMAVEFAERGAEDQGMLFAPVYSVEPVDKTENLNKLGWEDEGVLSSKKGFVPKEIVGWGYNQKIAKPIRLRKK